MNDIKTVKERLYSLDLLKVLCMFMIVLGHGFLYGGTAAGIHPEGLQGPLASLVATLGVGSVNIFILISGFFLSSQDFRLSRIIKLWLQVEFYSLLIMVLNMTVMGNDVSMKDMLIMIFPVSYNHFWFISAYFGLSLLSPLLNWCIVAMNKRQHFTAVFILVFCFSLWSEIIPRSDPFGAGWGYCLTWFIVLYMTASYLRRYINREMIRTRKAFLYYLLLVVLIFFGNMLMNSLSHRFTFLQDYDMGSYFSRYNCILVYAASVALFLAFLGMNIQSSFGKKVIGFVSKLTLGVYLIHGGPYTSHPVWKIFFSFLDIKGDNLYVSKVILASVLIFISCIALDWIRSLVFSLFESRKGFNSFLDSVENGIRGVIDKACDRFFPDKD